MGPEGQNICIVNFAVKHQQDLKNSWKLKAGGSLKNTLKNLHLVQCKLSCCVQWASKQTKQCLWHSLFLGTACFVRLKQGFGVYPPFDRNFWEHSEAGVNHHSSRGMLHLLMLAPWTEEVTAAQNSFMWKFLLRYWGKRNIFHIHSDKKIMTVAFVRANISRG